MTSVGLEEQNCLELWCWAVLWTGLRMVLSTVHCWGPAFCSCFLGLDNILVDTCISFLYLQALYWVWGVLYFYQGRQEGRGRGERESTQTHMLLRFWLGNHGRLLRLLHLHIKLVVTRWMQPDHCLIYHSGVASGAGFFFFKHWYGVVFFSSATDSFLLSTLLYCCQCSLQKMKSTVTAFSGTSFKRPLCSHNKRSKFCKEVTGKSGANEIFRRRIESKHNLFFV